MRDARVTCGAFVMAVGFASVACGQNLTVQQPVFNVFSVNTTVSVPVGGSALLGGVSRAATGRSRGGPFRAGYGIGLERQASSASAHVWVHDMAAMDRALLHSAQARPPAGPPLSAGAEHALRSLLARQAPQTAATAPNTPAAFETARRETDAADAARYYQLGLAAERRGSATVARLHFEAAAHHGSTAAQAKLAAMATPTRSAHETH